MIKNKWIKIKENHTSFGRCGGGEVLKRKGYYFSYNPCVRDCIFDTFTFKKKNEETALCADEKWYIALGDFRKEAENTRTKAQAIALFNKLDKKNPSGLSTY